MYTKLWKNESSGEKIALRKENLEKKLHNDVTALKIKNTIYSEILVKAIRRDWCA